MILAHAGGSGSFDAASADTAQEQAMTDNMNNPDNIAADPQALTEPHVPTLLQPIANGLILMFLSALSAAAVFMFHPDVLRDGDTGWHLAAGRYIFEHLTIPGADPFSYTFHGRPWVAHEWLAEVFMHGIFAAMGWPGLMLVFGLCFGLVIAIISLHAQRWLTPVTATSVAALCFFGLLPALLARPHVLAWAFLACWVVAMLRARERNTAPNLWWALMMLLWANLHGSYAIGLFLSAVFALDALVSNPRSNWIGIVKQWALFGLACLLAAIATPSGVEGLIFPLTVSTMKTLSMIAEWRSTSFASISFFSFALYLGLFFCLWRKVRIPVVRLLLIIFLLHMALTHVRHQAVFLIVSSLILIEPLGHAYRREGALPRPDILATVARDWHRYRWLLGALALALTGLTFARLLTPMQRPDSVGSPATAISKLPPALRTQPVFNEYSIGGALIYAGIPVFIDGRADMYGDKFMQEYFDITTADDLGKWRVADKKWHFRWTILPPDHKLSKWLDREPDWRRFYADKWAVIHIRQAPIKVSAKADQIRTRLR